MSFDLDAVIAEEAKGDQPTEFTFTFDKKKYTMPGIWDARALGAIDDGRLDRAMRILVGPAQWATIEASDKTLTYATLDTLLGEWAKHCGDVKLGKSSRSTVPSKRTAKRSSTTSRRSTGSASLKSVRKS